MKRIVLLSGMVIIMSLLSACHQNPIKALSKEKQINVLLNASRMAEKEMGLFLTPGGGYYLSCMGQNEGYIDCEAFFKKMLPVIQQLPGLKNTVLSDFTNRSFFENLALNYQMAFFNAGDA